jgi:hypothetical protein
VGVRFPCFRVFIPERGFTLANSAFAAGWYSARLSSGESVGGPEVGEGGVPTVARPGFGTPWRFGSTADSGGVIWTVRKGRTNYENDRKMVVGGVVLPASGDDGAAGSKRETEEGENLIGRIRPDGTEAEIVAEINYPYLVGVTDAGPVWSPDGQWMLFADYRSEEERSRSNTDLRMVSIDGTHDFRLSFPCESEEECEQGTPGVRELSPTWSPDAWRIAFRGDALPTNAGQGGEIYVFDVDAETGAITDVADLTGGTVLSAGYLVGGNYPQWAGSHNRILVTADTAGDGAQELWVLNPDEPGAEPVFLFTIRISRSTPQAGWTTTPQWSSRGSPSRETPATPSGGTRRNCAGSTSSMWLGTRRVSPPPYRLRARSRSANPASIRWSGGRCRSRAIEQDESPEP